MRDIPRGLVFCLALALLVAACNPPIVVTVPTPTRAAAAPTPAPPAPTPALTPAPTSTPAPVPVAGGTLRVAVSELALDTSQLDPHEEPTLAVQAAVGPVYSGLVQFDPLGGGRRIVADLASNWRLVDDKTFGFDIRQDATFHNGLQVTAVDVLYSIDRVREPPRGTTRPRRDLYASIERVEAPEKFKLRIVLRQPDAGLLAMLASGPLVVRPQFEGRERAWEGPSAVGSGPFVFTGYSPQGYAQYPRYKDYFLKGKPYLDNYQIITIPDVITRVAGLRGGLLDVVLDPLPARRVQSLQEARPDLMFHRALDPIYGHDIVVNTTRNPFNDVRVRKALRLALDDQAAYSAEESPCPSYIGSPGGLSLWALPQDELAKRPEAVLDRGQRLAEARKLLADAGLSAGLTVAVQTGQEQAPSTGSGQSISGSESKALDAWGKLLVKGIEDIGGKAETQSFSFPKQFQERLLSFQYDLAVYQVPFFGYPDPNGLAFSWRPDAPRNYSGYSDPEIDRLLAEQARTLDWARRLPLVQEAERRILDSYAGFYLPRPKPCETGDADAASQPWVRDFRHDWMGARLDNMRFYQVWIDPAVKGNFKRP